MIKRELVAVEAHELRDKIIQLKKDVALNSFALGYLLKRIRDEKLYRSLDHDTFNEFLGDPDIGMGRSTAYFFIELHERYVERLNVPPEKLAAIGTKRLQLINPVVSTLLDKPAEAGEWLDKAEHLSFSDLKLEVDEALDRPKSLPGARGGVFDGGAAIPLGGKYLDYCKAHNCVLHPAATADLHHFPRTRGAGAEDWKVIPLCRKCHSEYHQHPKEWMWANRIKVFDFFYNLIVKLYEEKNETKKP